MSEQKSEDEMFVDGDKPTWAHKADHLPHKPDWVDAIPHRLWSLGEVFFPIPRAKKGWNWPHHSKRFTADDEILNAYLEAGSGYGIACAGDLAVIDVDEKEYTTYFTNRLPETIWQLTGSREGHHIFYFVDGLENRITLRVEYPHNHMTAEGYSKDVPTPHNRHFGEVKCDEHGYVVGPGSVHPSGNKYGPLKGERIERIEKQQLKDVLKPFTIDNQDHNVDVKKIETSSQSNSQYEFFNIEADDVMPWLEPDKRIEHPGHGSSTGMNFMKNSNRKTFMCWRHDYGGSQGCALTPLQLLAQIRTGRECDDIRRNWPDYNVSVEKWSGELELYWEAWMQAHKNNLISTDQIPYRVIKGFALAENWIDEGEEVSGKMYWDAINWLKCLAIEKYLPQEQHE